MPTRIQIRGGTAAEWAAVNPVLAERELGVDEDTGVLKIGNGVTAWANLNPVAGGSGGTGTGVHNDLTGRSAADAHPTAAVTGLDAALGARALSTDARLSDQRTPTDGSVTAIKLADSAVVSRVLNDGSVTDVKVSAANRDGTAATPSMRTLGVGASQALPGDHASTTNARTPTAHQASHATGGGDVLTPADIGAATVAALAGLAANGVSVGPMWQEPSARVAWPENLIAASPASGARSTLYDQSPDGVTAGTIDYPVWLPAGTWKATVEAHTGPVAGIGEVLLDGTSFGTFDAYSASGTYPAKAFRPVTVVTVTVTGMHTVTVRKTGAKNASATGYIALFIAAHLRKTG